MPEVMLENNVEESEQTECKCQECKEVNLKENLTEFNGLNLCWFCLDNASSYKRKKK